MSDTEIPDAPANALLAGYYPESEVAAARGVCVRTLRGERQRGEGPPFVRIGKAIYYPRDGFRQWLKSIEQRPTRARKAA